MKHLSKWLVFTSKKVLLNKYLYSHLWTKILINPRKCKNFSCSKMMRDYKLWKYTLILDWQRHLLSTLIFGVKDEILFFKNLKYLLNLWNPLDLHISPKKFEQNQIEWYRSVPWPCTASYRKCWLNIAIFTT